MAIYSLSNISNLILTKLVTNKFILLIKSSSDLLLRGCFSFVRITIKKSEKKKMYENTGRLPYKSPGIDRLIETNKVHRPPSISCYSAIANTPQPLLRTAAYRENL